MMTTPRLQVTGLCVHFGGVRAVDGIDLTVDAGELVGLIGPNGAGKTTVLDAIGGFVQARGRTQLDGHEVSRLASHRRAREGLARTWQAIELFHDLSVQENLEVAARDPMSTEAALARLGIGHVADRMPAELSHAERKLVGVARAIAQCPKLLCLDEPAAGLDTTSAHSLGDDLAALTADGIAALLVDHDMSLVLRICQRVYVMEFGRIIAEGTTNEIRADQRVIEAYLGRTVAEFT